MIDKDIWLMNFDKLIGEDHYRAKDGFCYELTNEQREWLAEITSSLQKAPSDISGIAGSAAAIAAIAAIEIMNPVVKQAIEAALNRQEYLIQLCALSELSLQEVIKKVEELPYDPYNILAYYRKWGKFPELTINN